MKAGWSIRVIAAQVARSLSVAREVGADLAIGKIADMIAHVVGCEGTTERDTSKVGGTPQKLLDVSLLRDACWTSEITLE